MLASILIVAFSLALLIYWFHYSCMLILRNEMAAAEETNAAPAAAGRFAFSEVLESLQSHKPLDPLRAALERDYRVLTYLIEHAAGLELATLEDRILMFDYRLMRVFFWVTRKLAPGQARNALAEMANVLGVLAQHLGQQAEQPAEVAL